MKSFVHILTIEPVDEVRDRIREAASSELGDRYQMTSADSMAAGLELLATNEFDVALLGLSLPDGGGLNPLLRLREAAPSLPVVVLLKLEDEAFIAKALRAGAQDYLVLERLSGELLIRIVHYAIERKHAEAALLASEEAARRWHDLLLALHEVSAALMSARPLDELCRLTVELGRERLTSERLGLWLTTDESAVLQGTYGTDESGVIRDERGAPLRVPDGHPLRRMLDAEQASLHLRDRPLYDHGGQVVGVGECAIAKVWDGERVAGWLITDNLLTGEPISSQAVELLELYAAAVGRQIARLRVERRLREREQQLRTLFEKSPDPVLVCDEKGDIIDANLAAGELCGASTDELSSRNVCDLTSESLARQWKSVLESLTASADSLADATIVNAAGETRLVEVHASRIDYAGQPALLLQLRDMTDRRSMEDRLRLRARERALVAQLGLEALSTPEPRVLMEECIRLVGATLSADCCGVLEWQPEQEKLLCRAGFGWQTGVVGVGQFPLEGSLAARALDTGAPAVIDDWSRDTELKLWPEIESPNIASSAAVVIHATPEPFGVLEVHAGTAAAFTEDDVNFLQSIANVLASALGRERAEQERQQLRSQLVQSQKMESLGALAGGVAHDFSNVLTSIIGNAQLALTGIPAGEIYDCVQEITEQAQRGAGLVAQLLAFARRAETEPHPLDLGPLLKETMRMLRHTVPENIDVHVDVKVKEAVVNADLTQMQQVVMNLCVNAAQAMPNGGDLWVALDRVTLDEEYCRHHAEATPGDCIRLTVRDTGCGIRREIVQRIFEPFFTTKQRGEGTGLGLSVVYGNVRAHNGHITVYTEPGQGAEFRVHLPAIEARAPAAAPLATGQTLGGSETLLLVEDDPGVLHVGQAVLGALGYNVLAASNGEEALAIFREAPDEIDLVLTDMVMPKMGGLDLYYALAAIAPDVKVLLSTGYSLPMEEKNLLAAGIKGVVPKPFVPRDLARQLREVLDAE